MRLKIEFSIVSFFFFIIFIDRSRTIGTFVFNLCLFWTFDARPSVHPPARLWIFVFSQTVVKREGNGVDASVANKWRRRWSSSRPSSRPSSSKRTRWCNNNGVASDNCKAITQQQTVSRCSFDLQENRHCLDVDGKKKRKLIISRFATRRWEADQKLNLSHCSARNWNRLTW